MIVIVMAIAWLVLTVIWTVYEERKWLYRMTKQPLQESWMKYCSALSSEDL